MKAEVEENGLRKCESSAAENGDAWKEVMTMRSTDEEKGEGLKRQG